MKADNQVFHPITFYLNFSFSEDGWLLEEVQLPIDHVVCAIFQVCHWGVSSDYQGIIGCEGD